MGSVGSPRWQLQAGGVAKGGRAMAKRGLKDHATEYVLARVEEYLKHALGLIERMGRRE